MNHGFEHRAAAMWNSRFDLGSFGLMDPWVKPKGGKKWEARSSFALAERLAGKGREAGAEGQCPQ